LTNYGKHLSSKAAITAFIVCTSMPVQLVDGQARPDGMKEIEHARSSPHSPSSGDYYESGQHLILFHSLDGGQNAETGLFLLARREADLLGSALHRCPKHSFT
jgi:hypothetical protein